jgi:hypothetical protein
LALFVDRQDHGVLGRIDVKPDDIDDLFSEAGILRQLEQARLVRLQAVRAISVAPN